MLEANSTKSYVFLMSKKTEFLENQEIFVLCYEPGELNSTKAFYESCGLDWAECWVGFDLPSLVCVLVSWRLIIALSSC